MNKKSKIIVSVVGIAIVLLALLGITYAYYLTRIEGNTNTNSISVTTADLKLKYGDGNGLISKSDIMPGTTITKTFTVSNEGESKVENYVVVLEQIVNTLSRTTDLKYTLTCELSNGNSCGSTEELIFPSGVTEKAIFLNSIDKDVTHNYTLTVNYINLTDTDQSTDMGSSISALVNIKDSKEIDTTGLTNPSEVKLLANEIINNAKENKNGTKLLNVADTPVAEDIARYRAETTYSETSWDYGTYDDLYDMCEAPSATTCTSDMIGSYIGQNCEEPVGIITKCDNGKPIVMSFTDEYESSLVVEQDDLGTSYYYRGAVEDNYVTFADMCWRIVRINGDGSTKLILEDQDQPCSEDINGNWDIPTTTGGSTKRGNFGYTQYSSNTLTASDGTTKNSSTRYLMDYLHGETDSASSMATAFKNFQSTFTETELSKLKAGNWCLNDTAYDSSNNLLNSIQIMDNKIKRTSFNYDSLVRLYNNPTKEPTLKCNGTIMNDWDDNETNPTPMYVGAITADEIVYAGGKAYKSNENYYLINNYQKSNYKYFWSLSPDIFYGTDDEAFVVRHGGDLFGNYVNSSNSSFRPSVSLASSAVISSGEGTLKKPYVIG